MSRASVTAQVGTRSGAPESAASAHARAEAIAGLRWAAARVVDRRVLVVADAIEVRELATLESATRLFVLAADDGARTLAARALPEGARLLDGTLADGVPQGVEPDALVWLSAVGDEDAVAARLEALLRVLPDPPALALGCRAADTGTFEVLRARTADAREAESRSEVAVHVAAPAGPPGPKGRRYVSTAPTELTVTATEAVPEPGAWLALAAEHDARVAALEAQALAAQEHEADRDALRRQLLAAESELARIPGLLDELDRIRHDRDLVQQDRAGRVQEIEHLRAVLADVTGSLSWRITAPLRAVKAWRR